MSNHGKDQHINPNSEWNGNKINKELKYQQGMPILNPKT